MVGASTSPMNGAGCGEKENAVDRPSASTGKLVEMASATNASRRALASGGSTKSASGAQRAAKPRPAIIGENNEPPESRNQG